MTETIEGEVIDVTPAEVRTVAVVQQPGQALVNANAKPEDMVAVAARLATVLKDIVERQKLYAVIQGKKFPQVEAWQTIGRLDNVVAREARPPIRNEDGSWEAYAELIRLSDGMVIGSASAMCGSPDDEPWGGTPPKYGREAKPPRPENARRSMAATRAISRAFRGQYAWIMALAGYEVTPAEEMPRDSDSPDRTPPPVASAPAGAPLASGGTSAVTFTGTVAKGNGNGMDLEVRQTESGQPAIGFKVTGIEGHPRGRKSGGARAFGPIALAIAALADELPGQRVIVTGSMVTETIPKQDGPDITYEVIVLDGVSTDSFTIPDPHATPSAGAAPEASTEPVEDLSELPW